MFPCWSVFLILLLITDFYMDYGGDVDDGAFRLVLNRFGDVVVDIDDDTGLAKRAWYR